MPSSLDGPSPVMVECWWPLCCTDSGAGLQQHHSPPAKRTWLEPLCMIICAYLSLALA